MSLIPEVIKEKNLNITSQATSLEIEEVDQYMMTDFEEGAAAHSIDYKIKSLIH